MSNNRLTELSRAIRAQLGTSTSIAVGVALISTPAAHATAIPQMLPEKSLFRVENAVTNRELVFIDADIPDPNRLLIGLKQGVETIILDRNQGGIEQITRVLESRTDITAVHIVAHGEAGLLKLGKTQLDAQALNEKAILLRRWFRDSGHGKPDLLLYACDLARGEDGAAFVERLAVLTGADIAASTDKTGIGGDWELEYNIGSIETALAFKQEYLLAYPHSLATFTVTITDDDADGTCDADCTLREAVEAANLAPGIDTIVFDAAVTGTITLTLGEIDITEDLVMNGPGATTLAISGGNISRIFDIGNFDDFTMRDLTLRDGFINSSGGAIRSDHGTLRVEDSVITGNTVTSNGGGIYAEEGDVYIIRTEISDNYAGTDGGGLFQYTDDDGDTLTMVDSLVRNNEAEFDGGGIALEGYFGGTATILNSEISGNIAGDDGGGIYFYSDNEAYYTYITNSTISNNTAADNGGGIFFYADDDGYLIIDNSTISGNTAGGDGGGISFYSDNGAMEISNSTISNNYAGDDGGGILIDEAGSGVEIRNSTIVSNEARYDGGGIYNSFETLDVYNSIIAENTAGSNGPDVYGDINVSYSLISDTNDANITDNGGNIFNIPSGVSPTLVNAGGPTMVHLLDPGSPAINAGEPVFTNLDYDQRGPGFPRVLDGRLDMGAIEMQPQPEEPLEPPIPVPTLQNWALILLALLLPGVALRWRGKLEKKLAN